LRRKEELTESLSQDIREFTYQRELKRKKTSPFMFGRKVFVPRDNLAVLIGWR
jgi:hypothetical protein